MADKKWVKVELGNTHDFNVEPEFVGVLTGVENEVGPNKSKLYSFEKQGGEKVSIWGSAVIDSRLKSVAIGSEIKIVSKGEVENKATGRTYKDYQIFIAQ